MVRRRGRADHLVERRDAASEIIERAVEVGDVGVEALGRRLLVQAMFEAGRPGNGEVEVSGFERALPVSVVRVHVDRRCRHASSPLAHRRRPGAGTHHAQLDAIVGVLAARTASCWPGLQQGMMALDLADANLAGRAFARSGSWRQLKSYRPR